MSWLPDPADFAGRVEHAMAAAGWPEAKRAKVRELLAADNGPVRCPRCDEEPPAFRAAQPGERLTFYCTSCGGEGPADALGLVAALLGLEYAT